MYHWQFNSNRTIKTEHEAQRKKGMGNERVKMQQKQKLISILKLIDVIIAISAE